METRTILALLRRCIGSDRDRDWNLLLEHLEPRLRRLVRFQLRDLGRSPTIDLVDETVQEVYCRLLAGDRRVLRRCRARNEAELRGYLRSTVRSVIVSQIRNRCASKRGFGRQLAFDRVSEDLRQSGRAFCPETRFLLTEARGQIRSHCRETAGRPELGSRNAWIVERALLEGWSSAEIGAAIGLRASSVQSVLHRFWTRFRERMERDQRRCVGIEKPVLP